MTTGAFDHQGARPDDAAGSEKWLGASIAAAFFVGFLGWAAFAPLDAGAYASGQIAVSGNRQAVQHREGGVVRTLSVAEGDRVQAGQVLLRLDAGELTANERAVTAQIFALVAQRERLISEQAGRPAVPDPAEFRGLAAADRALADEALRLQRSQFRARGDGRSTETGVLSQRSRQLQEQMDGYDRQVEANLEQQRLIDEELTGLRSLAAQGFAPLSRVRALERTAAGLKGEEGSLRAQIARTREQMGETRLQTVGVGTRMREDVAESLRQIDVQLNELRPRLMQFRAQLARAEIRSPATGQVVGLEVFTPGGVVQPGQTLMEIVPDRATQVISARIDPSDIDNLRVGQETEVKFPGLLEFNPPIVRGRVTRISADSFTDPTTGLSHFTAEIVVPPEQLQALGPAAGRLRAGMPVETVILTRKRTALAYLVEPLTRTLWRTGAEQ